MELTIANYGNIWKSGLFYTAPSYSPRPTGELKGGYLPSHPGKESAVGRGSPVDPAVQLWHPASLRRSTGVLEDTQGWNPSRSSRQNTTPPGQDCHTAPQERNIHDLPTNLHEPDAWQGPQRPQGLPQTSAALAGRLDIVIRASHRQDGNSGRNEHDGPKTAIKELMQKYDEKRQQWIRRFGNDEGFDKWFTRQIFRR